MIGRTWVGFGVVLGGVQTAYSLMQERRLDGSLTSLELLVQLGAPCKSMQHYTHGAWAPSWHINTRSTGAPGRSSACCGIAEVGMKQHALLQFQNGMTSMFNEQSGYVGEGPAHANATLVLQ